jgi:AraC family transcriptional activator of mtrCDE
LNPADDSIAPPMLRITKPELDKLMGTLEVQFVKLAECLVTPGWRLELEATATTGIHYNLGGEGRMIVDGFEPIELHPHTLVVVPRGRRFTLEAAHDERDSIPAMHTVHSKWRKFSPGEPRRFVAGEGSSQVFLICGYFEASFSSTVELFADLGTSIVEHFSANDEIDNKLKAALTELIAQDVGSGAMTEVLLKQVLLMLLRRSLNSNNQWVERFSILKDPQLAEAFAEMASNPGKSHSIRDLAKKVGLSRSVFMVRFTEVFGRPPMLVLRELRMRRAAVLLKSNVQSIDEIASEVGYASRSSFLRAFRKTFSSDPSEYRSVSQQERK